MTNPARPDSSGTDPRLTTVSTPVPVRQTVAWWMLVGLLALVTVLLFLPWSDDGMKTPSVDLRQELIWSSAATVVIGVVALVFPGRWMSYLGALPTLGALTDLGPVLWPESGSYPWPVKAVVLALSAVGIIWFVTAYSFRTREQSTRWIIVPVVGALTLATLWLPWVIVSRVGPNSGSKTAVDLLFGTGTSGAPGVLLAKIGLLLIMLVGLAGTILPLTSRRRNVTRVATILTTCAVTGLVLFCLALSIRGDAVITATDATGERVAIAGFMLIALVWDARLKAADIPYYDDGMDHSGIIPIIMTGEPVKRPGTHPTEMRSAPTGWT